MLLFQQQKSITALSRELSPARPRSTVSQAIHQARFPRVRAQIIKHLGL